MTNQEAIDTLRLMMNVRVPEEAKALSMAIEAMKKQVPKKPIIIKDGKSVAWMRIDCPNCKAGLRPLQEFCDICGQPIDWSDEE